MVAQLAWYGSASWPGSTVAPTDLLVVEASGKDLNEAPPKLF